MPPFEISLEGCPMKDTDLPAITLTSGSNDTRIFVL